MRTPPLLVHVHMPKTAGSALNQTVLLPRFERRRVWLAYGVTVERRKRLAAGEGPEAVDFISGHIPFGAAGDLDSALDVAEDALQRYCDGTIRARWRVEP